MKIIKCGGASLNNYQDRKKLYNEIKEYNGSIVLIVSAFQDGPYSTKKLASLLDNNYTYQMKQELITIGEIISSIKVVNELLNEYIDASLIYKEDIGIHVNTSDKMDEIVSLDGSKIKEELLAHKVVVVPGFIGINQDNKQVSLNKNGSDLTAILVAKMLDEKDVFLYKDALGLSSINPKLENKYKLYKSLSYDMMHKIVLHGNPIIQEEALLKAKEFDINIHMQHYINHLYGTRITRSNSERIIVFQILDNDVFIDGYINKEQIENILFEKNILFDYILQCNSYLKIVTGYDNESTILKTLHDLFMKGEL